MAIVVAVASVVAAYTAMKPGGEPLAPPKGIARMVLWVAALLAAAFGALLIVFLISEPPGDLLSILTVAFSCVGVAVALIRWLRTRV